MANKPMAYYPNKKVPIVRASIHFVASLANIKPYAHFVTSSINNDLVPFMLGILAGFLLMCIAGLYGMAWFLVTFLSEIN